MARRRNEQHEDLPESLTQAILGMTIVDRGAIEGDDGEMIQRTMLMFAGETVAAWHHSEEETHKRLKAGWKLTEGQLLTALRMIRGRMRAELRKAAAPSSATQHRSVYASWNPNEYLVSPPQGNGYDYY